VAAELEGSALPVQKPATGHDHEPVASNLPSSQPFLKTCSVLFNGIQGFNAQGIM
jgi:hypothetical protein